MKYRGNFDVSVYFVADSSVCRGRAVEDVVLRAVKGGATCVQLRNKSGDLAEIERQALAVKKVLSDYNIPFILNDYVELAAKIGTDGVHIGQGDMGISKARDIIGDDKILGVTAFAREHYDAIDVEIVDYVGTGAFYATKTKPDKAVLGAGGFADLARDFPLPVVAIGGITPDNASNAIKAGASGVAMMRAISEANDPENAVRLFTLALRSARDE